MSRFVHPLESVYNKNGKPLDGAKRTFFEPGLLIKKDTFSDQALTIPNANPVIANGSGTFPEIWLDGDYDTTLTDKNDVLISGPLRIEEFNTGIATSLSLTELSDFIVNNVLKNEEQTLSAGQTTVTTSTIDFTTAKFHVSQASIDSRQLVLVEDYNVTSSTVIELTASFPNGTKLSIDGVTLSAVVNVVNGDFALDAGRPLHAMTFDFSFSDEPTQGMQGG